MIGRKKEENTAKLQFVDELFIQQINKKNKTIHFPQEVNKLNQMADQLNVERIWRYMIFWSTYINQYAPDPLCRHQFFEHIF